MEATNQTSPRRSNEVARLAALHSYKILDTATEADFDHITSLAALVCGVPFGLLTLIDEDRHWFKSAHGIRLDDIPRRSMFCDQVLDDSKPFIVQDALADSRVSGCHFVVGEPHVRFYAGFPLEVDEGHVIGTLCVLDRVPRNLTDSQLEAMSHLGKQVVRLLELRKAYFRINGIERMKNDLTDMLVHDLRSPLAAVTMNLDSFLRDSAGSVSEELRADVSSSVNVIHTLVEMVSSILDVSRMEEEMMPIDRKRNDLKTIASAAIARIQDENSRVQITGEGSEPAMCDAQLFTRVISNLVANAVKHSRGQVIEVIVSQIDGCAMVSVVDKGAGIPMERHPFIFQKFGSVQGDPKNRAYSTGLGLPFCKMVVEAHGGVIGVDSKPEQGSRFWFTVPLEPRERPRGPASRKRFSVPNRPMADNAGGAPMLPPLAQ